jgi:hypothetical protein
MTARFDSLERGKRYVFVVGHGCSAIVGVFHELAPDGTLRVGGAQQNPASALPPTETLEYRINPDNVLYVYAKEA